MISPEKKEQLRQSVAALSRDEQIWLSGHVDGVLSGSGAGETAPAPAAVNKKVTIAYGTESGNSKKLAGGFAARAKKQGIQAKVVSLDQYRLTDLAKEEYFLAVISTQGEGEPPASAKKFYDHIHQNGFTLPKMKFGILALGDTSYPLFCKAGEDVDTQLSHLGGERLIDLQRCDVDYESEAQDWFNGVLNRIGTSVVIQDQPSVKPAQKTKGKKTYEGSILSNINLNDRDSAKQTHHIEISAEGVPYQPGDALGLIPHNPEEMVAAIIDQTGISAGNVFAHRDETYSVFDLLRKKLNISYLPERVVAKYAAHTSQEIPPGKLSLLQLLARHPVKEPAVFEQFIQHLEPITPRLYSIASSPAGMPDEIHLTVGRDSFKEGEELKYGLGSDLLCTLKPGDSIEYYIHHNDRFRLPAPDRDIIMIGPGTGIAPFRAFLAERAAQGGAGRNWLFFGDQHFVSDFLYQTEIQQWLEEGVLSRVDLAFSRDQEKKIYVQDKLRQQEKLFLEWLDNGASVYVCGAKKMGDDIDKTMLRLLAKSGGSAGAGENLMNHMVESGRYLKDVY